MNIQQEVSLALDKIATIDHETEVLELEKQKAIDSILTPELQKQIQDIKDEYAPREKAAQENRSNLEKFVREAVVNIGESVDGKYLQAVFTQGRYSWDKKIFDRLVKQYPEISSIRTQGDPFVSIRKIVHKEEKVNDC